MVSGIELRALSLTELSPRSFIYRHNNIEIKVGETQRGRKRQFSSQGSSSLFATKEFLVSVFQTQWFIKSTFKVDVLNAFV